MRAIHLYLVVLSNCQVTRLPYFIQITEDIFYWLNSVSVYNYFPLLKNDIYLVKYWAYLHIHKKRAQLSTYTDTSVHHNTPYTAWNRLICVTRQWHLAHWYFKARDWFISKRRRHSSSVTAVVTKHLLERAESWKDKRTREHLTVSVELFSQAKKSELCQDLAQKLFSTLRSHIAHHKLSSKINRAFCNWPYHNGT